MAGLLAERSPRGTCLRLEWRTVAFFHWAFAPELVRGLLPPGFEVDAFDGRAWIGLTPFTTTFRLGGVVPLPGRRRYGETNLRTYVKAPDGTDGVWFFSLDVTNFANVPLGRMGFPYHHANLHVEDDGTTLRFSGRRFGSEARYDLTLRAEPFTCTQHALDVFLTGRWHTYAIRGGMVGRFDIEHDPWPLHRATLVAGDEHMIEQLGLPRPDDAPIVHYSPGVDVRVGWPVPHRGPMRSSV
jgi:uncharacterized protein YqjF (DUF2071 family)